MNAVRDEPIGTGSITDTDTDYEYPRDPAEIWLARQWQRILGFGVGIRENFFGLGGNSLDAARVIDAILTEFGVQLPLNVLTEHPTVESLATVLRDHDERPPGSLIAIQDGDGTRAPLFLVHPDDGQVGRYCRLANALGEEFAVFGLQAQGLYHDAEPLRAVPSMADAYVDAVRATHPIGPYFLGGCDIGAAIAHEMAVRLDDVRLVAAIDAELLEPVGTRTGTGAEPEFAARSLRVWQANRDAARDWRPSPHTVPMDVFGRPRNTPLPATVVQRTHDCGTEDRLAAALRELIG